MVSLFFDKREAFILLGGNLSEKIIFEQGVPQGDVISPYIFLLSVEILSIKINYTKHLIGVKYAKSEARSELFADDLSGLLERDEKNLRNFARILVNFHKVSELATNLDKNCVIPVGDFSIPNYCHDLKLKWESSFKVLGIVIDNRLEKLQANLDRIFDKVESKIWAWSCYGLTIFGRITVAKSLLLSQYTYCPTILDSSNKRFIKKVEYQINNFILYGRGGSAMEKKCTGQIY